MHPQHSSRRLNNFQSIMWKLTPWIFILALLYPIVLYVQTQTVPEDPYTGQKVFKEKGCIKCHTVWGTDEKVGPNLKDQTRYRTFLGLAAVMWNHLPKMLEKSKQLNIKYEQLQEDEVLQLIAYLCFLRYFDEEGNILIGNKHLQSKGCLRCHTIGEKESKIGPDFTEIDFYISPLFMAQAMWNHGPNIVEAEQDFGMKHIKLEGDEIINITAALQELTRPSMSKTEFSTFGNIRRGNSLYYEKGCATCHESIDNKKALAPDLQHLRLTHGVLDIAAAMWNHGPAMWEKMKEQQIQRPTFQGSEMADLVSYIFYNQFRYITGNPNNGEKLFQRKACTECHTLNKLHARKNEKVFIPTTTAPVNMIHAMWNHAPLMQKKMEEQRLRWPKFSEREMMDLFAFLSSSR